MPLGFLFGKKPKVPSLPKTDFAGTQQKTVGENIAALPKSKALAQDINAFNLEELSRALEFALPSGLKQAQKNIRAELRGELDPEDTKTLIRSATAQGFNLGIGGSGAGRNLVARDLGIGIQQQKQRGLQNFMALSQQFQTPRFDVTSMFLTPQQRIGLEVQQNQAQFDRDVMAASVEAQASPFGSFLTGLVTTAVGGLTGGIGTAVGAGLIGASKLGGKSGNQSVAGGSGFSRSVGGLGTSPRF